jgi:uncharacterized membrane protein
MIQWLTGSFKLSLTVVGYEGVGGSVGEQAHYMLSKLWNKIDWPPPGANVPRLLE